jgi:uroporphyrinogen-III decarboxylase
MWMLEDEEAFAAFLARIGDFAVELARVQAEDGRISGMYIWGDVAYVNSMMFSPEIWRKYFKPIVRRIIDVCHDAGLMTIYHGCGNASMIFEDFIETGLDGYNPLEVKAGLDAVKLKEQFGGKMAFVGNIDVRALETGDKRRIAKEVLYKLKAGRGGGYIVQSDHSVSSDVSPGSYEYLVSLVREYGVYPLDLEKIDRQLAELHS